MIFSVTNGNQTGRVVREAFVVLVGGTLKIRPASGGEFGRPL